MLKAVFIPASAILYLALQTPIAQRAIGAGFGLYTNGTHTALLPQALPGWFRIAVSIRDMAFDHLQADAA